MRKLFLALCGMVFMAGVVVAGDMVVLKSYDKKAVTVTDKDGKEATYTLTDATKYIAVTKDGDKESKYEDVEKMLTSDKAAGKAKLEITVKDGKITEMKTKRGKN
jgi:hypothetical protein